MCSGREPPLRATEVDASVAQFFWNSFIVRRRFRVERILRHDGKAEIQNGTESTEKPVAVGLSPTTFRRQPRQQTQQGVRNAVDVLRGGLLNVRN